MGVERKEKDLYVFEKSLPKDKLVYATSSMDGSREDCATRTKERTLVSK